MGDDIEDTTSQICFSTYPDFNDFSSTECLGTKWSLLKRAHAAVDRDKWSCISMLSDMSKMTKVCFHHCCNGVGLRTVLGLWGSWGILEPFQDTSWENRKTWSTEWIKYSDLNALALEWPRCFSSSTCFFSFRCRLVREESLHVHNAPLIRSAFVPGGSWLFVLAGHAPWSFANLSHRWILRSPKDPTRILGHWRCYKWMLCEGHVTCPFLTKHAPSNRQFQNLSYPFMWLLMPSLDGSKPIIIMWNFRWVNIKIARFFSRIHPDIRVPIF